MTLVATHALRPIPALALSASPDSTWLSLAAITPIWEFASLAQVHACTVLQLLPILVLPASREPTWLVDHASLALSPALPATAAVRANAPHVLRVTSCSITKLVFKFHQTTPSAVKTAAPALKPAQAQIRCVSTVLPVLSLPTVSALCVPMPAVFAVWTKALPQATSPLAAAAILDISSMSSPPPARPVPLDAVPASIPLFAIPALRDIP